MLDVLFPRRNGGFPWFRPGFMACLGIALALCWSAPAAAQQAARKQAPAKASPADADADDDERAKSTSDDDDEKPRSKAAQAKTDKDGDDSSDDDSAFTPKTVLSEIFRDPRAESLLDVSSFKAIVKPGVPDPDVLRFKAMAEGTEPTVDRPLIDRVIDAMAAELTDHANIEALISLNTKVRPGSETARAIQKATATLLEPIFIARGKGNGEFLRIYNRSLAQKLPPLLKNHLIPRIQAMIILGQSGSPEMLPIYEAQIKDKDQTVWVKLWALEGMSNIIDHGGRLGATPQVNASRVVADFLLNEEDIPWPVQLRALEVLTAMREGFEPTRPGEATMANAAMQYLSDRSAKPEVRAEAARALGVMRITSAVPKYNYTLIAYSIGYLTIDMATDIASLLPDTPAKAKPRTATAPDAKKAPAKTAAPAGKAAPKGITIAKQPFNPPPEPPKKRVINPEKAKYLIALLVGPVYQSLSGVPSQSDSGLLHATTGDDAAFIQKVFDHAKGIAKSAVENLYSGARDRDENKEELRAKIAALRSFLDQNEPAEHRLVQGGPPYPVGEGEPNADAQEPPPPRKKAAPAGTTRRTGRRP